jgi:outer membrane protein OmpA-like peptidoglycan-associated protein
VIRRITRHSCAATGVAAIVAATAGCGAILTVPTGSHVSTAPATLTAQAAPSMLVAVTGPGGPARLVSQVVTVTARPREDLDVLDPDMPGRALIASTSPSPARVAVPGRPAAPGRGASSYQEGQYQHALAGWRVQVAAARRTVAARTKAAVARWAQSLRLPVPATGAASQRAATLPQDCALAASTVSGLVNQAGSRFHARVVLLSVSSLSGMPPTGELDGDDLIVLTSYLPGAAAASAAQLDLLAAGAAFAAVLGPEATPAQLDHLVSEALAGRVVSQVHSGQALFANNSARLGPAAARVLGRILSGLRRPDASGVVNGFASAPGSARHNLVLSQERALAVATYLEARGIARSSLVVVGHGAGDLVAPGPSGHNRRVVVVIDEPAVGGG